MKKKCVITVFALALVLFGSMYVSAICCEKLKESEMWCKAATSQSQCDPSHQIWLYKETCNLVPECYGTCVNPKTGECSQYTPKAQCVDSGGVWSEKDIDEVPACQEYCCILGQDSQFITETECKNLMSQYGIQGIIRKDIASREKCEAMQTAVKRGACVVGSLNEKVCNITTNIECTPEKVNELSKYLQNPTGVNQIEVRFYENHLCTASINGVSISNCAKSKNTVCKDNKVYYIDLCGNLANIYDSSKYNNVDYWNYMIEESDDSLCKVGARGSTTCGNCDTTANTVCQNYKDVEKSALPNKPQNNEDGFVCGDLSCKYKGVTYQHGESWCEGTAGTLIINRNLTTGAIFKKDRDELRNVDKYNLPGSRYYKLVCSFGEVIVEECGDYRNSVCIQGKDDYSKRSIASCVHNPWKACSVIDRRSQCESNNTLCKWIPGYRWDLEIASEKERKEFQGSCVPLIAPGFDFWNPTTQGNIICASAGFQEIAFFEVHWTSSRENMGNRENGWGNKEIAHRCLNGCYAIPYYGMEFNQKVGEEKKYPEEIHCTSIGGACTAYNVLTEFYDESEFKLPSDVSSYYLSTRRGQYCHKAGKPDKWVSGKVTGKNYDCTTGAGDEEKDEDKERDYPIYLTNDEWIKSITERAKSMGDCGYKASMNGRYSDPESELITAIFQKLKQNGEVKENVTVEQKIYRGNAYVKGDLERYETEMPISMISHSCLETPGATCISAGRSENPCEGGEVGTGECSTNMVCCVFPEL